MIQIEQYEAKDKRDLEQRERFYLQLLKATLNRQLPTRTQKEYYKDYLETLAIKSKEYKNNNKETISIKSKEYRDNNKEKIEIRGKEYYKNNKEKKKTYYKNNKEKLTKNICVIAVLH